MLDDETDGTNKADWICLHPGVKFDIDQHEIEIKRAHRSTIKRKKVVDNAKIDISETYNTRGPSL